MPTRSTGPREGRPPIELVERARATRVVAPRGGPGGGNFDPGDPIDPPPINTNYIPPLSIIGPTPQLVQPAGLRTVTIDRTGGPVPVFMGGPLPSGGFYSYRPTRHAGLTYYEVAFGDGEIAGLLNPKMAKKPLADLGLISGTNFNIHLGAPGDTTDALISVAEPGYVRPEGVSAISFAVPDGLSADPFSVTADVKGIKCRDPRSLGSAKAWTRNPVVGMFEAETNNVWGRGLPYNRMDVSGWAYAADKCDEDLGGFPRWAWSIKCDVQQMFSEWLIVWRQHILAYVYPSGGLERIFLDLPRDPVGVVFSDKDEDGEEDTANLIDECQVFERTIRERPTVLVGHWTNALDEFKDDTVEYPETLPRYQPSETETALIGAIDDTVTSLTVGSIVGFPEPPFVIKIGSEEILVGATAGADFSSCERGVEGTTAASHADADPVTLMDVVERIEKQISILGTTEKEQATRTVRTTYKKLQLAYDITTRSFMSGLMIEPGDRCVIKSRDLDNDPEDVESSDKRFDPAAGVWNLSFGLYRASIHDVVVPLSVTALADCDSFFKETRTDGETEFTWFQAQNAANAGGLGGGGTESGLVADALAVESSSFFGGASAIAYKVERGLMRFPTSGLLPGGATLTAVAVTIKPTSRVGLATLLHVGTKGAVTDDRPYIDADYGGLKTSVSLGSAIIQDSDVGAAKTIVLSTAALAVINTAGYTYLSLRIDQDYHVNPPLFPPFYVPDAHYDPERLEVTATGDDRPMIRLYYTV